MFSHGQDGDERHWQHVLQLLAHPNEAQQLACLTELQQWLSFATDEHLGSFPLQRVLHALFLLLQKRTAGSAAAGGGECDTAAADASEAAAAEGSQEALDEQLARELAGGADDDGMATQKDLVIGSCVYLLLDVLPMQTAAVIARTPEYMEALKHQLSHLQYIDTGEKFLLILCRVIDEQPLLSFLSGAAAALLPILDFFQLDIQRKAVRAAAKALAAAAAATDKAVAAAAAEAGARRQTFFQQQQRQHQQQRSEQQQQQQQQRVAAQPVAAATAAPGQSDRAEPVAAGGTRSSCSNNGSSKLETLKEQLEHHLQQEKQQHRELVVQLEEYRSLIHPTLPFFSSLLSYKDEALLQGACQSWRSTLTIFVCMNTAAAASAAAVAGLEFAVAQAAVAIDGDGSMELGSSQQQQQQQQDEEADAKWLLVCQKAYADRMELLAGELAAAGSEAATALQQLVARTVTECSSNALAWQQQLMLQDAMYVLSVFAAYSDKIAAELLQQQMRTSDFQEAVNKLVKRQEMLLLESVAALGVSLLPAVRFKLPLQQPPKERRVETEASARAADVLTIDQNRAAVFAKTPELLGRALHTLAAPMLSLMESSVTRDLSRFVLQLLLAAACTAAEPCNNQQQLQQQLVLHLDLKTLGEICAHTLSMGQPDALNFVVMNLVLQLLLQHGSGAAVALQAAGVRDRIAADHGSSSTSSSSSDSGAGEQQPQNAGDGSTGILRFVIRAATAAAAAAAGEPIACVDLIALLQQVREACLFMFEQQLQQLSHLGSAPPCSTQQRLQQVASSLTQQVKQPLPAKQQQHWQQWLALVELRKLLEDPTRSISACEIISSQLADALCCYLLGASSSSSSSNNIGNSPCCRGSCRCSSCREQQELRQRGLLFLRAFLFPLTDSPPQVQEQDHSVLEGVDWSAASPDLLLRLAMLAAKCLSRVEQFPVLQQQLPAVAAAARDVLPPHLRAFRPAAGGESAAAAAGRQPSYRAAGLQQRPRGPRGLRALQQMQQEHLSHPPGDSRRQQLLQQQFLQQPDPFLVVQDLQRDLIIVAKDIKGEQSLSAASNIGAVDTEMKPAAAATAAEATTTEAEAARPPARSSRRRFRSRTGGGCRSPAHVTADAAPATSGASASAAAAGTGMETATAARKRETATTPQRAVRGARSKATAAAAAATAKAGTGGSTSSSSSNANSSSNNSSSNSSSANAGNSGCLIKRRRGQPGNSSSSSSSNAPPPSGASGGATSAAVADSSSRDGPRRGRGTVHPRTASDTTALAARRTPLQRSICGNSSNSHTTAGTGLTPMMQLQELMLQHQRGSLFGDVIPWGRRFTSSISSSSTLVVDCRAPLSRVETEIRRTVQTAGRAPLQQLQQQQPQQAEDFVRESKADGGQQQQQQQEHQQHKQQQHRTTKNKKKQQQQQKQHEQEEPSSSDTRAEDVLRQRGSRAGRSSAEGEASQERQQQLTQEDEVNSLDSSDSMDVDSHIKTGRHSGDNEPEYRDSASDEEILSSSGSSRSSEEGAMIFEGEELADSDNSSNSNSSCDSSPSDGSSGDESTRGPERGEHEEPVQRSAAAAPPAASEVAVGSAQAGEARPARASPRGDGAGLVQQQDALSGGAAGSSEPSSSCCCRHSLAAVGAIQLYVHSVPVPPQMPVMEALNLYGGYVALAKRSSSSCCDSNRSSGWFAPAGGAAYRRLQQMLQGGSSTFEMLLSTALLADLFPSSSGGGSSNSSTARQREIDALPAFLDTRRRVSVAPAGDAAVHTDSADPPSAASAPATSGTGRRGRRSSSGSGRGVLQVDLGGRFCIMAEERGAVAQTAAAAAETAVQGKSLWDKAHTIDYLVLPAAPKTGSSSSSSGSSGSELLTTEGLRLGRSTPLVTSLVHPALGAERLLQQLQQEQQQHQRDALSTCCDSTEPQQQQQQRQHRLLEDLAGWCVFRTQKETAATTAYLRGDCSSWHRLDLLLHAASDEAAPLFYALPSAGVSVTRRSSSSLGKQASPAGSKGAATAKPVVPASTAEPASADGDLLLPNVFEDAAAPAAPFVVLLLYLHNLLQQLPRLYAFASIASTSIVGDSDSTAAAATAATLFRAAASSRGLCEHPLGLCSNSGSEAAGAAAGTDVSCWSSVSTKAGAVLADPVAAVTSHSRTPYWLRRLVFACPFLFPLQLRLLLLLQQHLGSMRGQFVYKVRLKEAAELLLGQRQSSSSSSSGVQPLLNIPTTGISSSKAMLLQRLRPLLQLQGAASGGSSNRREQEILADLEGGASLPRTKVKMPRSHLVESAAKVMDHLLASNRGSEEQPVLEVEFAGEEGVGQGPTNEFYAEVLEALLSCKDPELFLSCSTGGGLFPRAYLTDISRVPVDMLRRPRVSPLVQQQQRRIRRRAIASRTDRTDLVEGAEDMEEDLDPSSSNNSNNSTGVSPRPGPDAAAAATTATESGKLERQLFSHFRLLGQLAAKALVDGRSSTTDTGLHAFFWEAVARPRLHQERLKPCNCMEPAAGTEYVEGANAATAGLRLGACYCGCTAAAVAAVAAVDEALGRSLQQMVQYRADGNEVKDMCCSFVLPQGGGEALVEGGGNMLVSNASLDFFIQRLAFVLLVEGIFLQASAFRLGFGSFCPLSALSPLLPMEVSSVLFGDRERTRQDRFWTLSHLRAHVAPDHGFTSSSAVYGHFLEVLVDFNPAQRAAFLKFVTGSTILPAGGFAGFRPLMKVVRKNPAAGGGGSDCLLPSVMTCSNYIKLPNYSSKQILKERLLLALEEGQGAFTLS